VTTTPHTSTDINVLWQNLADALNALIDAGQVPYFHDLYGSRNDWRHQPYATGSYANAPWVVLDLATRKFTVSSRERTLTRQHTLEGTPDEPIGREQALDGLPADWQRAARRVID
jgi:hypothetical protein